jgi:hypothetical protein
MSKDAIGKHVADHLWCDRHRLVGCSSSTKVEVPQGYKTSNQERIGAEYGTVWGGDESMLQRGTGRFARQDGKTDRRRHRRQRLPVAGRARDHRLLPLAQADPFGGVIITDWHSPPETPDERFKLNVYILDTVLRADGLKVVVFRQTSDANGWRDAAVDPQTATKIEDNILTRARELRIAALNASG